MVFPYLVLHDGVYYPAGTDVPVEGKPSSKAEKVKEEPTTVEKSTDIIEQIKNTSNVFTLRKIAKEHGIQFESDVKMVELKAMLLEKLK